MSHEEDRGLFFGQEEDQNAIETMEWEMGIPDYDPAPRRVPDLINELTIEWEVARMEDDGGVGSSK